VSTQSGEWAEWATPRSVPLKEDLELLIEDAAARAAAMLAAAGPGEADGDGDPLVDAVRMLATPGGAPRVAAGSRLTGLAADELRRLVLAWRHGGPGGVAAALGPSPCGEDEMAAAIAEVRQRRVLAVGDLDVAAGSVTDPGAGVRVRLGTDGRWHPFTAARGEWWPASGAAESAGAAYQAALRARSLRRPAR
jgi:hypothetical protein